MKNIKNINKYNSEHLSTPLYTYLIDYVLLRYVVLQEKKIKNLRKKL